eukprot:GEMP01008253.1.p1 GENE.GEMP01008253.1~~GEMP01008253.1.p1  ORF type:complete len:706 (+),score=94.79 GEMP01008253.1:399-2516(+)
MNTAEIEESAQLIFLKGLPPENLLDECAVELQQDVRFEVTEALYVLSRMGRSNVTAPLNDQTKGVTQKLCEILAHSILSNPACQADIQPVDVCNAIYFLGKARFSPPAILQTVSVMTQFLSSRIDSFTPTLLSNLAWGVVVLGIKDPDILGVIALASINCISDFTAQGLSNVAWAFAKSGKWHAELLDAIAHASVIKIHDFHNQNLANISWAYAVFGQKRPTLMRAIATEAFDRIQTFHPNVLVTLIWSFAMVGMRNLEFVRAVSTEAMERLHDFTAAELVNVVYSYYALRVMTLEKDLITKVSQQVIRRIKEFTPGDLSNIAWTYSKAREPDMWDTESLFSNIAQEVIKRIEHLKNSELASLAWSFAHLGFRDDELFEAIAKESINKMKRFNSKSLAQLAWAFGALRLRHDGLLVALTAKIFEYGWDHYKPFEVSVISWTFARLLCRSDRLMGDMTVSVVHRMDQFSPVHLARITKSLVTLGLWRADFGIGLRRQTQTTQWPLGALIQMCDAVFPYSLVVEDVLHLELLELLDDLRNEDSESFERFGVDHCGALGTAYIMRQLGIEEPNYDFIAKISDEVFEQQGVYCVYKLNHEDVVIEDTIIRRALSPQVSMEPPCPLPISAEVRDGSATPTLVQTLMDMRDDLQQKIPSLQNTDSFRQLAGSIQILATMFPSLKCISALMKLRDSFPQVTIEFVQFTPCTG